MCLDDATAIALLERTLPPAVALEIDAHVDACPECARLVAALGRMAAVSTPGSISERASKVEAATLLPGEQIGRYVVERRLGEGAMGIVYVATDPELRRRVAIKVLRARGASTHPNAAERIRREARVMARIAHPNVVGVHDVGLHGGSLYIVMELIEGANLRQWLREARTLEEILAVFVAAGRGLAAAHTADLVHRDFKADNVIVQNAPPRVAVTDFGLAKDDLAPSALTAPRTVLGTPAYMAPEQRLGSRTTAKADQFSFCVALLEALHGALPPTTSPRRVPPHVREAIARGMAEAPDDRFASMDELLAALAPPSPRWTLPAFLIAGASIGMVAMIALATLRPSTSTAVTATAPPPPAISAAVPEPPRLPVVVLIPASAAPVPKALPQRSVIRVMPAISPAAPTRNNQDL
jgi:serine/threonine protein kinase